jgi:hypothetical protein
MNDLFIIAQFKLTYYYEDVIVWLDERSFQNKKISLFFNTLVFKKCSSCYYPFIFNGVPVGFYNEFK